MRRSLVLLVCMAPALTAQSRPTSTFVVPDTAACPSAPVPVSGGQGGVARQARDSTRASATRGPASQTPTIVLLATASAREVRFAGQPQILVRLCGAVTDSVRVVERRNLPDPVQPGTTYRDVYIAVEIIGHLSAQCLAGKIGVAPAQGGASGDPCASGTVRDTAQARPVSPRRPPE